MLPNHTVRQRFWAYTLPSMFGQLLNSLFIIVDGFFIGQNLGDAGLAAINVAWPLVALMQAVSMAVGTGGSVQLAIDVGRDDLISARRARDHAVFMLSMSAVIMGVFFFVSYPVLLPLLGANQELFPLTEAYIRVVCICAACQVFTTGVMPLLRGSGKAIPAMYLTVLGLVGNIFLDWLFIQYFSWGMEGVALATALSQGTSGFLGLFLLLSNREFKIAHPAFRPAVSQLKRILRLGCPTFGLTISTSVLILLTNLQALRYGGTEGVAVYAVLSYVLGSVLPLVSGVGDGVQPLLGNAYGAQDSSAIIRLRRMGLGLAVGAAVFCSVVCWAFRSELPSVFGASPSASLKVQGAMWTLCVAFPFMAVLRFCSSYFCALGRAGISSILAYCEPLLAQPFFLFLFPLLWKLSGVWMSYPAAVIVMAAAALILLKKNPIALYK